MKKRQVRAMRRRELACQLAADVMASRPDVELAPALWSLSVFFESYMARGSAATRKPFGPKAPPLVWAVK